MRLSVSETARLTGVSVRTLHYYDEIGLLQPSEKTESGYRYYDDQALSTLQQILFYRELEIPLKDIRVFLSQPNYDPTVALQQQRTLLQMKKKRLEDLIGLVDGIMRGDVRMDFDKFSTKEMDAARREYAEEARQRWGNTPAYRQSAEKTSRYTDADWAQAQGETEAIFKAFANCLAEGNSPEGPEAQQLVKDWQDHITSRYYDCTKEVLAGLGKMYIADERFTKNLDRYGQGTARLMSEAIEFYCR